MAHFINILYAIAGVANIGEDTNWTGHHFAQANWYAFGRLAWNHNLSAEQIADEWIRMTFSNENDFVNPTKQIMLESWHAAIDYMMPLVYIIYLHGIIIMAQNRGLIYRC